MTPDERPDTDAPLWRKSTYSNAGNQCVEVARKLPFLVAVRDSKAPEVGALAFSGFAWRTFTAGLR